MSSKKFTRIFQSCIASFLMMVITLPLAAVEGDQVQYIGGTLSSVAPGSVGKLDMTSQKELKFVTTSSAIAIPYERIDSYQYTEEVAHHLGVLPTLAIVMVKYRQRRHYFRISYRDEANVAQSVVLEVPKEMPKAVSAVLESRVPTACRGARSGRCTSPNNSKTVQ